MFYTTIENRIQFEKCLILTRKMEREFIFDCGSSDENPTTYCTTKFITDRAKSLSQRMSRCVGVYSQNEITLESEFFGLPDNNISAEFHTLHYYHWLTNNKGTLATGHVINDKNAYLASLGFVKGKHKLSKDQIDILKFCHNQFWNAGLSDNNSNDTPVLVPDIAPAINLQASEPWEAELALMVCKGDVMSLPSTQLKHYTKIKNVLSKAGGKYVRGTFVFKGKLAQDIQDALLQGETLNDKKKFQFFETTPALVKKAMKKLDLKQGESWLEPSAGKAALANAARVISNNGTVVELMPENAQSLREQGYSPIESDFTALTVEQLGKFDKIIANPPFTNNQDIIHIKKMFTDHLANGGRLVSFASQSWLTGSTKDQVAFRAWLKEVNAEVEEIEKGEFKASGTNVKTTLIVINKIDAVKKIAA